MRLETANWRFHCQIPRATVPSLLFQDCPICYSWGWGVRPKNIPHEAILCQRNWRRTTNLQLQVKLFLYIDLQPFRSVKIYHIALPEICHAHAQRKFSMRSWQCNKMRGFKLSCTMLLQHCIIEMLKDQVCRVTCRRVLPQGKMLPNFLLLTGSKCTRSLRFF